MAKQKEKKPLDKKGWVQTFELIGKAYSKRYRRALLYQNWY